MWFSKWDNFKCHLSFWLPANICFWFVSDEWRLKEVEQTHLCRNSGIEFFFLKVQWSPLDLITFFCRSNLVSNHFISLRNVQVWGTPPSQITLISFSLIHAHLILISLRIQHSHWNFPRGLFFFTRWLPGPHSGPGRFQAGAGRL